MFVEEQSVELLRDVITCNASISACEKGEQWQQALDLFVAEQSVKLLPDVIACIASISAREKREQRQQAAFVTAFTGQLVEFHLKSDGH